MAERYTVAELRADYDYGPSITDEALANFLAAETEEQNDLCDVPAVYPARLRLAIGRRVQRAIALKDEPLGLVTPAGDGHIGMGRVTGRDWEIIRLEVRYYKTGTIL